MKLKRENMETTATYQPGDEYGTKSRALRSDQRDEISAASSKEFLSIIKEVDGIHHLVKKPREQVSDAAALRDLVNTPVTSIRVQNTGSVITPSQFVSSLITEYGKKQRKGTKKVEVYGQEVLDIKMGAGGCMTVSDTKPEQKNPLKRVPYEKPPFTISDLKKVIPPHCFQRFLIRSFSYVVYDLTGTFLLYYIATAYFHHLPTPFSSIAWVAYWVVQGCVLTGVWVIAHECGHHSFSDYQWVDDTVGFILHSSLLVPYFSWKYSHRRHHSNTGSLVRDEVFVPKPRSKIPWYSKYLNNPLGRIISLFATLTLGWPLYLAFNVSGRPYDRFACHYSPNSPIYNNRERFQICLSDIGIITMSFVLYRVALIKGLAWVICVYGIPLMIVNGFLVLITYLQHTHPSLPHYDGSEWEWLKGALATVDRDYGVLNKVFHNITDTHVVHHLFSTMPHYNAMEATKAVKPLLGEYYRFDGTPSYAAMWREAKECLFVEPDEGEAEGGVFWYKNKM